MRYLIKIKVTSIDFQNVLNTVMLQIRFKWYSIILFKL